MNAQRRKEINQIMEELEVLKEKVDSVMTEEQEYLENIPENLQGSTRYEVAEEAAGYLESAYSSLEEAMDYLESSLEG